MIIDNYRKQVITHQQNIAKLQADIGRLAVKAAAAMKKKMMLRLRQVAPPHFRQETSNSEKQIVKLVSTVRY